MNLLTWLLYGAGAVHLLIALAGVMAPRVLNYREEMGRVAPVVREVFFIHNWYMTLFVLAFAVLCFVYTDDLAGRAGTGIGRFLGAFLGGIWLLRLVLQYAYHNAEIRRRYPTMNVVFSGAFLYLGIVFTLAASGLLR